MFPFALTHEMKFAFYMDRTTQSLRKNNLFKKKKKKSPVILDNTNSELSVAKGLSTFTLPCPKSRITQVYLANYSTIIK